METKKLQFALPKGTSELINEMKQKTGASSRSAVIRGALALYETYTNEDAKGIVTKDGETILIVIA